MDTAELARIQMITTIVVTVANVVLVLLTLLYVYLTRRMVMEMQASRDPSVFVDVEFPETEGRVAIGNSGQSPALNIKFMVQDEIPWLGKEQRHTGLKSIRAINDGVSYLPPGRVLKYIAGIPDWNQIDSTSCILKIHVDYESEAGKKFKREYFIDLSQYKGVLFESFRDSNLEVARAVRDAERSQRTHESASRYTSFLTVQSYRQCPMCAEQIPKTAKKCSHCGELIDNGSAA